MLKFSILVLLGYLQLSYCYNNSISHKTYSKCDKESIIGPGSGYVTSYMKFQKFVPIQSLVYGNGSIETRIKFYFQGRSHFGVGFLAQSQEPQKAEPIFYFQISCSPNTGNKRSYLFLNTGETRTCDYREFSNPMDDVYFTEIEMVINNKYGFIAAFLPESGSSPFLTCYDPSIVSKIKYIGLTGSYKNRVRYIYDCPV